jgi:protein transport protein SEC61 subunit gamma-like protein
MDIMKFLTQCRRVFVVATKPTSQEFKQTAKITGLGIILIGLVGFLIWLALSSWRQSV